MDWEHASLILLAPLLLAALWMAQLRSTHPMTTRRRQLLTVVRMALVLLVLLALMRPAWEERTQRQAVVFVIDYSQSLGENGVKEAIKRSNALLASLPADAVVGAVSVSGHPRVLRSPSRSRDPFMLDAPLDETKGARTDLATSVALARGVFPPGTARRIVLVTDGMETHGDLLAAAHDAAAGGIVMDAVPLAGDARPDVRVVRLTPSRSRSHEGAAISLSAELESSIQGEGVLRLFENGVEVDRRAVRLTPGEAMVETFTRTPERRSLYSFRARIEGVENDTLRENNEAMTLVDVRGRPVLLYVEGEKENAGYLVEAMAREGVHLQVRPPEGMPRTLEELAGFDGIILSDIPAHRIGDDMMALIREYVETLGGGFLMIGGENSFGVGGYYRTPIEDILPVRMKAPDKEERFSTALALVIDRSGSMSGQKIEICKSAAIATAEMLSKKDYMGVIAFDSTATWIVPMDRVASPSAISAQIAAINAGGGTNIYPGMTQGHTALQGVKARAKHMIVLTDGQTQGQGYEALATQMRSEKITVSTVGVGQGADVRLLQAIAAAGGGKFYMTTDPSNIPKIFTQDAMVHLGRLIREEAFKPAQVERHPMLSGWQVEAAPELLGYVKTIRKSATQVPLVTPTGDPLLAHWRFGLGKVSAFTSDCSSRWASLWVTGWPEGYSQFWGQVIRETAREPQGRLMDIQIRDKGEIAEIDVDLLQNAAEYRNSAQVEVDLYFVAAQALGSHMKHLERLVLDQTGPGRYGGSFVPEKPGLYLARARSGAFLVSAGLVHEVSGEAATGQINTRLLEAVTHATGGRILSGDGANEWETITGRSQFVELSPYLLTLFILLFLLDVGIRRLENVLGMVEWFRDTAFRSAS